jgi:hypothetical protein
MVAGLMPVYGQNKKVKHATPVLDTITVFHDIYKGNIPGSVGKVVTVLQLDHKLYHDEGLFTLTETFQKGKPVVNIGEWTVLKGDAKDDNATVVELDPPGNVIYYLRRPDGSLQLLDTSLREIKPAANYLLKKEVVKKTPIPIAKPVAPVSKPVTPAVKMNSPADEKAPTLAGTYIGSQPYLNANRIETTLTIQCKDSCNSGNYILRDKYVGTPMGDRVSVRRGKWKTDPQGTPTNIIRKVIVLDADKPGKSAFYMVKDDGNLLPLDSSKLPLQNLLDPTLEKK